MDNTTVAWISGGAALGGGLIAGVLSGVYQHWHDRFYGPELHLDFGDRGASLVEVKTGPDRGNLESEFAMETTVQTD